MRENETRATLREDAYRLLAVCYYPPSKELLEENSCALLAILLDRVAPDAARYAREAGKAMGTNLELLQVEHARLFIGPFHLVAPPYGSIYLDDAKTVMSESTAKVAAFYHSCGLHLADDIHELPDHIAVELEFISFLAYSHREALAADNHDEVGRLERLQLDFLETYLLPWLEPFTRAIIDDGESPYFQAVARCTSLFIAADYAALAAKEHV